MPKTTPYMPKTTPSNLSIADVRICGAPYGLCASPSKRSVAPMTTKPAHSTEDVIADAEHALELARARMHDKDFKQYVEPHEIETLSHNVGLLASGAGSRHERLAMQVRAGVHAAQARVRILQFAHDTREKAKIRFPNDAGLQQVFLVGVSAAAGSSTEVIGLADKMIAAAKNRPNEAPKVGLDDHAVHLLEIERGALLGTHEAHLEAEAERHTQTTLTDSLQHLVTVETAHLRRIGRLVDEHDPAKLEAWRSKLPRHTVEHHAAPPPPPPKPTT